MKITSYYFFTVAQTFQERSQPEYREADASAVDVGKPFRAGFYRSDRRVLRSIVVNDVFLIRLQHRKCCRAKS